MDVVNSWTGNRGHYLVQQRGEQVATIKAEILIEKITFPSKHQRLLKEPVHLNALLPTYYIWGEQIFFLLHASSIAQGMKMLIGLSITEIETKAS